MKYLDRNPDVKRGPPAVRPVEKGVSMTEILSNLQGAICRLTLNRPDKRNALDRPALGRLTEELRRASDNAKVRVVMIDAVGRSFCAGADVDEWAAAEARGELDTYGWSEAAHELRSVLEEVGKPTLAVIQGSAVGAGVDLALACDFRLAGASASFRCGYTGMAYAPDMGGTYALPRLMAMDHVKRFIFLNERWSSQEALARGLVTEVAEDSDLAAAGLALAERLARAPTFAIGLTKGLLRHSFDRDLRTQLAAEKIAALASGHSQDAAEALAAAAARREPVFKGH